MELKMEKTEGDLVASNSFLVGQRLQRWRETCEQQLKAR
jgi:hypothetical protein